MCVCVNIITIMHALLNRNFAVVNINLRFTMYLLHLIKLSEIVICL